MRDGSLHFTGGVNYDHRAVDFSVRNSVHLEDVTARSQKRKHVAVMRTSHTRQS